MILTTILIGFYFVFLFYINHKKCNGLDPFSGLLFGVFYFIYCPTLILNLVNTIALPLEKGAFGYWSEVNLDALGMKRSLIIIQVLLFEFLVVAHICVKTMSLQSEAVPAKVVKISSVFRTSVWVLMVSTTIQIFVEGGIIQFFTNHWYSRHDIHYSNFGSSYVLLIRLLDANSAIITASSALLIVQIAGRIIGFLEACGIVVLIIISQVVLVVITGNRIYTVILLIASISALLAARRYFLISILLASYPIIMFFGNIWARIRGDLLSIIERFDSFRNELPSGISIIIESLFDGFEGVNVLLLFHIIDDFGEKIDFFFGESYLRVFVFFVPREVLPTRMEPLTHVFANIYEPGQNTSFSATMLGEVYSNFGAGSFIVVPLITFSIFCFGSYLRRTGLIFHSALGFLFVFWITRSVFADNAIQFMLCMVLLRVFKYEKYEKNGYGSAVFNKL